MPEFLCFFQREIVVLSDGTITTCCLDPLGLNAFANIYTDSFDDVVKKYIELQQQVTRDVNSLPKCKICYEKIEQSGFPDTGKYTINPSPEEIDHHITSTFAVNHQVVIELTNQCNLRCDGCMQSRVNFNDHRSRSFLDIPQLEAWISPALHSIKNIRLYNYGETFLHPDALHVCEFLKNSTPSPVIDIATNGMLIDSHEKRGRLIRSGIDIMYFSIHGGSQASAEKYMTSRYDFEKVVHIIQDMQEIKRQLRTDLPRIHWKYLLFEWNDTDFEINKARKRARELGISPVLFVLPGYPSPSKRFANDPELLRQLQSMDL